MKRSKKNHLDRRYLLRLLRLMAIVLLGTLLALVLVGLVQAIRWAEARLHPPRQPVQRTPASVGITVYEDVSFTAADGVVLRGWYIPSHNRAAVILGHGLGYNRLQMLPEARFLAAQGYGVLLFDWRAHGESGGEVVTFGRKEALDLRAAVDCLSARPEVDPNRIGVLGFSLGGAAVSLAAAEDTRLRAVVVTATYSSLEAQARSMTRAVPGMFALLSNWGRLRTGLDLRTVRPVDAIGQISPRPLLLIYGDQDDFVSGSAEQMYAAAGEPKELWIIAGAGHGLFARTAPAEYERRLLDFFAVLLE